MMELKKGYGYWDITHYPYGGCFKRAPEQVPVELIEDLGPKYGYKVRLNGAIVVSKYDSFTE